MALANKLSTRAVADALRKGVDRPTVLGDGAGLYLRLRPNGVASWFFVQTAAGPMDQDGKKTRVRREIGLGSASAVSLGRARELAGQARQTLAEGRDPFAEKAAAKRAKSEAPRIDAFGTFAEEYIDSVEGGWKNAKHRQQWRNSLRQHAAGLWKKRLDEIGTDDILSVLRPIWQAKPETADRVRGRIERVLDAAKARGLRPRDSFNPATWRGHLALLLPRRVKLARGHHAALPCAEAPKFITALRARPATAARALEFAILTAARTGEATGARWREIDMAAKTWTVPADRMKAGAEHVVPLSEPALALLATLRPKDVAPEAFVFSAGEKPLSNMAMAMLMRRMDFEAYTVHGFRSTFRDWAGDSTDHPRELIEQALAHTIQNKAEKAYRRGTAIEKRRVLMEDWAAFLATPTDRPTATAPAEAVEAGEVPAPRRRKAKPNPLQTNIFDISEPAGAR